jgi:hypothetical protein
MTYYIINERELMPVSLDFFFLKYQYQSKNYKISKKTLRKLKKIRKPEKEYLKAENTVIDEFLN